MQIAIKRIKAQNFKCFKEQTFDFSNRVVVSAKNGSGKSTINDIVNWVLFDKLADGTKADNIRPHDEQGKDIDFIDIVCELELDVDGRPITIEKTQKQKWVKKKGHEEATFEGNANSYVVNTIPKSDRDFKAYMSQFIDEDLFRMTSSAKPFLKMKVADRRKMLFDFVSGITDNEVVDKLPEFENLRNDLANFSIDELKGRAKKVISQGNDDLKTIPARIDELNNMRTAETDVAEMELLKNVLNEQLQDIQNKIDNAAADDSATVKANEISKLKYELADYERKANEELLTKRKIITDKFIPIDREIAECSREKAKADGEIISLKALIEENKAIIAGLTDNYKTIKARAFNNSEWVFNANSTVCPMCGRTYEADKIAEIKDAFDSKRKLAYEQFLADKDRDLAYVNERGTKLGNEIKDSETRIAILEQGLIGFTARLDALFADKERYTNELAVMPSSVDLSTDFKYQELKTSLLNMESDYEQLKAMNNPLEALYSDRNRINEEIIACEKKIASADNTRLDNAIAEYEDKLKVVRQNIANAERELDIYEAFERAKVKMLTDKINENFKYVKFVMFKPQVNGGYADVCDITVNGSVLGKGLNTGASIVAEVDICNTLQRLYNVQVPIIVDNAEALDDKSLNMIDCDTQMIFLKVSNESMRVEQC